MHRITGIQKRAPFSHSGASSSHYDHSIDSEEFSITKSKSNRIRIFFEHSSAHGQGVGLYLPSTDVATALGRALLMVSEGYSNDVTISI
jgi:hypothetical protein